MIGKVVTVIRIAVGDEADFEPSAFRFKTLVSSSSEKAGQVRIKRGKALLHLFRF
jgi:hypothetical protein